MLGFLESPKKPKPKFSKGSVEHRKAKCYNCVHSTIGFKIGKLTHHNCMEPEQVKKIENGAHPFDALVVFSDTCNKHEFKINL